MFSKTFLAPTIQPQYFQFNIQPFLGEYCNKQTTTWMYFLTSTHIYAASHVCMAYIYLFEFTYIVLSHMFHLLFSMWFFILGWPLNVSEDDQALNNFTVCVDTVPFKIIGNIN